jgi:hypothetical protein
MFAIFRNAFLPKRAGRLAVVSTFTGMMSIGATRSRGTETGVHRRIADA